MGARVPRPLVWLFAALLLGFGVFAVMAFRATTLEQVDAALAAERLADARAEFGGLRPLLERRPDGRLERAPDAPAHGGAEPERMVVLFHRATDGELLRIEIPFWFLRVKGPALRMVLSGTDFDVEQLGIAPRDLAAFGACPLLDESRADGSTLLVWTE
ncbi:MAG: hypothetical protein H6825_01105 [Planctomycetes bacterium]|nr:hypothetical protein [Planctomycetota bacterium]